MAHLSGGGRIRLSLVNNLAENGPDLTCTKDDAVARAERLQRDASDPRASVFVSASAGSGKTKLLIDRLLRLMLPLATHDPQTGEVHILPGVDPARIQSLTYTKAAAAEMATRLQALLGRWVTMRDENLDEELRKLDVPCAAETRAAARALFAQVLDCPGGMRIGTIHAFCQSLLRRFPLEASITPQFQLMEDPDTVSALHQALEAETLKASYGAEENLFRALSQRREYESIRDFAAKLYGARGSLRGFRNVFSMPSENLRSICRRLLALKHIDAAAALKACIELENESELRDALTQAAAIGTSKMRERLEAMLAWLNIPIEARDVDTWRSLLLTQKNEPLKLRSFLSKKYHESHAHLLVEIEGEAARLQGALKQQLLHEVFELNVSGLGLVFEALRHLDREKARRGLVDYEDLIVATQLLLQDPGAAWVLYQLDGGIDHLLLDEVQDTSPAQWEIARALTRDFFSGAPSREEHNLRPRTIFAVGDFKQSIFSFQGAKPQAFLDARADFSARVRGAGQVWRAPSLDVSFRSSAPVLQLVDAVFANPLAVKGLADFKEIGASALPTHRPARPENWGRVEIWPKLLREGKDDAIDPWMPAMRANPSRHAAQRMAEAIAKWLRQKLGQLPHLGQKPLRPGDVLILVRRRSPFLWALIRALKSANIDVATLIRANLTDQLAVQDMMALAEVLLLPQDDLKLATVLTSPLGNISDPSLMALAASREGRPLWVALQARHAERPEWASAWEMLAGLQARLDFATPFDILADALGRYGGRARFLKRLGVEARDALDDLMSMALEYEAKHAPSMQGFLSWLQESNGTVKRDAEAESDAVRIMTVHASKGLQSRLIILPDTAPQNAGQENFIAVPDDSADVPIMTVSGAGHAPSISAALEARVEAMREESHRLLYVALTRAQDWLVICGWESGKHGHEADDWYGLCAGGFAHLPTREEAFTQGWAGQTIIFESPTCQAVDERQVEASLTGDHQAERFIRDERPATPPRIFGTAPDWKAHLPAVEPRIVRPLAPSRPEGNVFGPTPPSRSPLEMETPKPRAQALRRGIIVHRLLQFLPDLPAPEREGRALNWLSQPNFALDDQARRRLANDVLDVINHPDLKPLFGPQSRAEQAITGLIGDKVIMGQVDRYAFEDGRLYLCDFKTNQNPPKQLNAVPETYRRQMAAYAAILQKIYEVDEIVASLIWTEGARVTILPAQMLSI